MNLEELREYCMSLPAVTEDIKWEDNLCFCIGEKIFTLTGLNETGRICFKVTPEEYAELIETEHFISAPYLGRAKWVLMEDFNSISEDELKEWIERSYEIIKSKLPKRILTQIEET